MDYEYSIVLLELCIWVADNLNKATLQIAITLSGILKDKTIGERPLGA